MKKTLLILALSFIALHCFPQNEAFTWFFGNKIRFNFNVSGEVPQQTQPTEMNARLGSICMSDKTGAPLFYSDGNKVWNNSNTLMPDGVGLYGNPLTQQPGIAFEAPGKPNQYYIVTTGDATHEGGYYSVIDMTLSGGSGNIVIGKKNIPIPGTGLLQGCIMALKHPNHKSYWVVFRTQGSPNMLKVYLFSEKGVKLHSEIECLTRHPFNDYSMSKFSPDGKHFIYSSDNYNISQQRTYEYYSFDPFNGVFLDNKFLFKAFPTKPDIPIMTHRSNGIEFSADSRYLYSTIMAIDSSDKTNVIRKMYINQFDMSRADMGVNTFEDLIRPVTESKDTINKWAQMQLARDGKIYVAQGYNKDNKNISRIYYPYKKASESDFRRADIDLRLGTESSMGMPLFVPSYLNRFDWTGNCFPESTQFTSYFFPQPTNLTWDFGDGSPKVGGLNPVHTYAKTGDYLVTATAEYSREIEEVKRIVRIVNKPIANLGEDRHVCPGGTIELGGMISGQDVLWSTGDTTKTIIASAGEYWVRAENYYGCVSFDTITLTDYVPPTFDDSNIDILPTTCTGATGFIHGVDVIEPEPGYEPFTYTWKDSGGNIVSNSADADNLFGGIYSLSVTDAHGCIWFIKNYEVSSLGNDFVDDVEAAPATCSYPNGSIRVIPDPRLSGKLMFSLDGGPWQSDSLYANLGPGWYNIKVMVVDNPTCIKDWGAVEIMDYPSPIINSVTTEHELDDNSDGTLEIIIPGTGFMYSITGPTGITIGPQASPLFTGLESGLYTCIVYTVLPDGTQCTSDPFIGEVPQEYSVLVSGLLGASPPVCKGVNTYSDLKIENFEGLIHLKASLTYDRTKLACLPVYDNLHPSLGTVIYNVNTSAGTIEIEWNSSTPLVLTGISTLLRIEFKTINPGTANIVWNISEVELQSGPDFHILPGTFTPIDLIILDSPVITINNQEICDGGSVTITASVNPAATNYTWTLPDGSTNTSDQLTISPATLDDEGTYKLIVSDINTCKDTSSMFLDILPLPDAGFVEDTGYYDVEALLQATEGYMQYTWNTGDITSAIWIRSEGTYIVEMIDPKGCVGTDSIVYRSIEEKPFNFYVPTAFTPNGDGINDTFRPVTDYIQIKAFSMKLFDAWGQLIFNTNNPEYGWDGKINTTKITNGMYLWEMVYKRLDEPTVKVTGHVHMIH